MAEELLSLEPLSTQSTGATQQDVTVPTTTAMGAAFRAGYEYNFVGLGAAGLDRFLRRDDDNESFTPEQAKEIAKQNGVPLDPWGNLNKSQLTSAINRQKRIQQDRAFADRAEDGFLNSLLVGGAGFTAIVADPTSFAGAGLRIMPATEYAALLATKTSIAGKAATRFGVGVGENVAVGAALEPAYYALNRSAGDEYGILDSAVNVGAGGLFGGTLNAGGGALGDALKEPLKKMVNSLSGREYAKIVEAGAYKLARDGTVNTNDLLDASLKRKLGYNVSDAINNVQFNGKLLKEIDGLSVSAKKSGIQYDFIPTRKSIDMVSRSAVLENNPEFIALKNKIGNPSYKNIYERSLLESQNPKKDFRSLEKRYGKGFVKEAEDYASYRDKRNELDTLKDKRKIRRLNDDVSKLDAKYKGKFSETYAKTIAKITDEKSAFQLEIDRITQSLSGDIELKRNQMISAAMKNYDNVARDFATSVDNSELERIDTKFAKTLQDVKDAEDIDLKKIDDEIKDISESINEFEGRTGVKFELEEPEFSPDDIVSRLRKYLNCVGE